MRQISADEESVGYNDMNFAYLRKIKDLSVLSNYCKEAEQFSLSNPDISITASRKAIEYMVKLLYGARISPDIRGLSMFDMLSDYDFIDYINDRSLLDAVHQIRRKGNQAVHEGNLGREEAVETLRLLHYVTGEVCVRLGVIESYPEFNPNLINSSVTENLVSKDFASPVVADDLIQKMAKAMRSRLISAQHADASGVIVDVHKSPVKESREIAHGNLRTGTDSGANGRTAFRFLAKYIADMFPDVPVLMNGVKSELIVVNGTEETVLVIKTGCTILGTKDYTGAWQVLPGVDYVLYAPELSPDRPLNEQFRIFLKEDFIHFWEELGLLRYKVSTHMRRRLSEGLGPDKKISSSKYGDVLCVQSFTNSGKKYPMVLNSFAQKPALTEVNLRTIIYRR